MLRPSPRRSRSRARLVELSGRRGSRNGRPSCRATLGQHLGVRRGDRGSVKSGNWPEDLVVHKIRGIGRKQDLKSKTWYWYRRSSLGLDRVSGTG